VSARAEGVKTGALSGEHTPIWIEQRRREDTKSNHGLPGFPLLNRNPQSAARNLRSMALPLCVLAFLWFTLINHLRIEWAVNPQYRYGWAMPLLCLFLIWRRATETALEKKLVVSGQWSVVSGQRSLFFLLACLALAWFPTRLIQEANPEWRLVSWALAIEVVGLTLLLLRSWEQGAGSGERELPGPRTTVSLDDGTRELVVSGQKSEIRRQRSGIQTSGFGIFSNFGFRISDFVFPICFFLLAVPWPTLIEGPLVQFLTRRNAAATVEVVGWIGLPALQRGNVIEVGTGLVGIDDACSGIRSFQATLMVTLFLGGLYRLGFGRRYLLVLGGFLLAFLFNVGRTSLLVWVASGKGMAAMSAWHDPTGVVILVAEFICLWLAGRALRGRTGEMGDGRRGASNIELPTGEQGAGNAQIEDGRWEVGEGSAEQGAGEKVGKWESGQGRKGEREQRSEVRGQRSGAWGPFSVVPARWTLVALATWLVCVEVGTELWYRWHEAHLPQAVTWRVELPRHNPTFRDLPFSDQTRQFLRYDEGANGTWTEGSGVKLQAIFLRWNPGRTAPHLAKNHTPEICLTAAGHQLISQSDLRLVNVHGLRLPFRSYVLKDENAPVHVFYCLWEDRADEQFFQTTTLTYANRFEPVLSGRRNSGQRSLEIAMWGLDDPEEAEAALARELEKVIKLEK